MQSVWTYDHRDLGESRTINGAAVLRPAVPLVVASQLPAVLGVLDSGSPISICNAELFTWLALDIETAKPAYVVPLIVGGGFEQIPMFSVTLQLRSPDEDPAETVSWKLDLGAKKRWPLPFAVLLGQRGWFDQFPTRIDARTSVVELSD